MTVPAFGRPERVSGAPPTPACGAEMKILTFLQEMANLFDDHIYATETAVLGVENDKDGNGVIGIVVTKQINEDNGEGPQVVGFVNPCDLINRGEQNVYASNEGEFFYAIAPDPDGTVGKV